MNENPVARKRRALGLSLVVGLAAACVTGQPGGAPAHAQGTLRIVARYDLPPVGQGTAATDVRWASDDSVYVSREGDGVFEIALDGKATRRRLMVPDRSTFRPFPGFSRLAVSSEYLVVAPFANAIAWRQIEQKAGSDVRFDQRGLDHVQDIDVRADKLILLGAHQEKLEDFIREPGVPLDRESPGCAQGFPSAALRRRQAGLPAVPSRQLRGSRPGSSPLPARRLLLGRLGLSGGRLSL